MVTRKRGHFLERWEVALAKAMVATKKYNDQDVLAYFTRPSRSINHRAISEIRTEKKHKAVKAASEDQLREFFACWPDVDHEAGLSIRGDELLIKAREAMIAAVHTFNSAGLTFRAEVFITTAMVAWTYLLHAWLKREGIDYRYRTANGAVRTLKSGAEAYWDLTKCLKHQNLPVAAGVRHNLEFLIDQVSEQAALDWMMQKFGVEYPQKGMALAMGTHSRRATQWLINGVIRLNEEPQLELL